MRAHADAIMVGIGTVLADDPLLTVRLPGLEDRSPVRDRARIAAAHCRSSARSSRRPRERADLGRRHAATRPSTAERALAARGVEVLRVAADSPAGVDLPHALQLLGARGMTRVFCEGGPHSGRSARAQADLVDELVLVTGRLALGRARRCRPSARRFRIALVEHIRLTASTSSSVATASMFWERA